MKEASGLMYVVGKVFNIIFIVLSTLFIILGVLFLVFQQEIYDARPDYASFTFGDVKFSGILLITLFSILLVLFLVTLILAIYSKKRLKNENDQIVPHSIMIVIGVIGVNIFYLLGGIFGIFSSNK